MDEVEHERIERQRCEVSPEGRARAGSWRECLQRAARADARERERLNDALGLLIGDLDETALGRTRQGQAADPRDGAVEVARGDALAAEDAHQRDPASVRMNVLVAMRSAKRTSSARSMAITTLPIRSVTAAMPPFGTRAP